MIETSTALSIPSLPSFTPSSTPATSAALLDSLNAIQRLQEQQAETLAQLTGQVNTIAKRPLKVADFNMPFGSLVGFIVKIAIASIPAAIIIGVLYLVIFVTFGGAILSALRGG